MTFFRSEAWKLRINLECSLSEKKLKSKKLKLNSAFQHSTSTLLVGQKAEAHHFTNLHCQKSLPEQSRTQAHLSTSLHWTHFVISGLNVTSISRVKTTWRPERAQSSPNNLNWEAWRSSKCRNTHLVFNLSNLITPDCGSIPSHSPGSDSLGSLSVRISDHKETAGSYEKSLK